MSSVRKGLLRFTSSLLRSWSNISYLDNSNHLSLIIRAEISRESPPGDEDGPVPGAAAGQEAGEAAQAEDGDPGHAL